MYHIIAKILKKLSKAVALFYLTDFYLGKNKFFARLVLNYTQKFWQLYFEIKSFVTTQLWHQLKDIEKVVLSNSKSEVKLLSEKMIAVKNLIVLYIAHNRTYCSYIQNSTKSRILLYADRSDICRHWLLSLVFE